MDTGVYLTLWEPRSHDRSHDRQEVLAIIPARGGSKGIHRKNLQPLGGVPLLAWSIDAALRARNVTRVIVSTEDPDIADTARDYGAEVPFLRPAKIAGDRALVHEAVN
ncbi:MAG: hypothetical protein D6E12_01965, partial [Desulfovibrio sp.]